MEVRQRAAALRSLLRRDAAAGNLTSAIVFADARRDLHKLAQLVGGAVGDAQPAVLSEDQGLEGRASAVSGLRDGSTRLGQVWYYCVVLLCGTTVWHYCVVLLNGNTACH